MNAVSDAVQRITYQRTCSSPFGCEPSMREPDRKRRLGTARSSFTHTEGAAVSSLLGRSDNDSRILPQYNRSKTQAKTVRGKSQAKVTLYGEQNILGSRSNVSSDYSRSSKVGISYQIKKVYSVDTAAEESTVCLDLNFIYAIPESDKDKYEQAQRDGLSFEQMADSAGPISFQRPPMVIYLRNTAGSIHTIKERIVSVTKMHDGERWDWYAALYMNLMISCKHSFGMRQFPFSRELIDVNFACKQPMGTIYFVPVSEIMPGHMLDRKGKVLPVPPRRNLDRSDDNTISNWYIAHHFIHIPDPDDVPVAASGNKYHRFSVVLAIEYQVSYILWNIVLVVFLTTSLNAAVFTIPPIMIGERIEVIFALLLTMASYKIAICEGLPRKTFLTKMDMYILAAFSMNFFSGLAVGIEKICINTLFDDPDKAEAETDSAVAGKKKGAVSIPGQDAEWKWVADAEISAAMVMLSAWVLPHLVFLIAWVCGRKSLFFNSWEDVLLRRSLEEYKHKQLQDSQTILALDRDYPPKPDAPQDLAEASSIEFRSVSEENAMGNPVAVKIVPVAPPAPTTRPGSAECPATSQKKKTRASPVDACSVPNGSAMADS